MLKHTLAGLILIASFSATANLAAVPLPTDFDSRISFADDYPMVLTGFTKLDEMDVINFYHSNLGEPDAVFEDIGRRSLIYYQEGKTIKVSIYQQDEHCEISILITE